MTLSLIPILEAQRRSFLAEGYPSIEKRCERIDRAIRMLLAYEQQLVEALWEDFGGRSRFQSRAGDVLGGIKALEYTKQNLPEWTRPIPAELPPEARAIGMRAEVVPVPLGVIGAMVPWNGPVVMTCQKVAGAFGAGNRIMVKSSELASRTTHVLAEAFAEYFAIEEAVVIEGGPAVSAEFAALPFDHLIFTGSSGTGRKVMRAAAENLVPVTLELGGKCPVVIGKGSDFDEAVARIVTGKLAGAGQICVAPDYVYVPKGKKEAFVAAALQMADKLYPDMLKNEDYTSVINEASRSRIRGLLADAVAKGAQLHQVPGQPSAAEVIGTRMPLVLATNVSPGMRVMQEEIFGPVLPVMEYEDFSEPLDLIARNPHPLSASYFGKDDAEREEFTRRVQAGSIILNDVRCVIFYESLPFGGVGASGIGRYRGYEGFKTFSNMKTILHGSDNETALAAQRPPFSEKAHGTIAGILDKMRAGTAAH